MAFRVALRVQVAFRVALRVQVVLRVHLRGEATSQATLRVHSLQKVHLPLEVKVDLYHSNYVEILSLTW